MIKRITILSIAVLCGVYLSGCIFEVKDETDNSKRHATLLKVERINTPAEYDNIRLAYICINNLVYVTKDGTENPLTQLTYINNEPIVNTSHPMSCDYFNNDVNKEE